MALWFSGRMTGCRPVGTGSTPVGVAQSTDMLRFCKVFAYPEVVIRLIN